MHVRCYVLLVNAGHKSYEVSISPISRAQTHGYDKTDDFSRSRPLLTLDIHSGLVV